MGAPQIETPRGDDFIIESQRLPLKRSCFLDRAERHSRLGNVLWCNQSPLTTLKIGLIIGELGSDHCICRDDTDHVVNWRNLTCPQ